MFHISRQVNRSFFLLKSHIFTLMNSSDRYSCLYCVPYHFSFSVAIVVKSLLIRNILEKKEVKNEQESIYLPHSAGY
jgi:hypothetical protein